MDQGIICDCDCDATALSLDNAAVCNDASPANWWPPADQLLARDHDYIELHSDIEYRTMTSDTVGNRRVITAWLGPDHSPLGDSDRPLTFGSVALEPDG